MKKRESFILECSGYCMMPLRPSISKSFSNLVIAGRRFSSNFEGQSVVRIQNPLVQQWGKQLGRGLFSHEGKDRTCRALP